MRTLLLLLLFVAVPLAGGSLKPEQESDFWKDSGVDLALVKSLVNDQLCSSSKQYFRSCRSALLEGARQLKVEEQRSFKSLAKLKFSDRFKFEESLELLAKVPTALPLEFIFGKMINAQLSVFDRFASLIPKSLSRYMLNGESKTYYGMGIETEATAAGLFIFNILPHTPAEQAGLRVHDRIISFNGLRAANLQQSHALSRQLGGKAGDTVKIEIERGGRLLPPVELRIAPIVVSEIEEHQLEMLANRYLRIRLRRFSRGICEKLTERVQAAAAEAPLHGLILDLRHNLGGLVSEGECVAQLFTANAGIVSRQPVRLSFPKVLDFTVGRLPEPSRSGVVQPVFAVLPLVVLIDAQSASASEIVAGALQDFSRAWVVGERSYGKGITQMMHNLDSHPELLVAKTVSHYVRPSGFAVHAVGVTPNFEVPFNESASAKARAFMREENQRAGIKFPQGKNWSESNPSAVQDIRGCISRNGRMALASLAVGRQFGHQDGQAAFALAALSCR